MAAQRIPNVLTIAGLDPSGGAGILADLKAFSALRAYGMAAVAALTAQNTRAVTGIAAVDPGFVRLQIDTVFADVQVAAAKTGMLASAPVVCAVADALAPRCADGTLPVLVVDPVMIAKSGDALLAPEAVAALIERMLPLATVLTPNLPEAAVLLGRPAPTDRLGMIRAVEDLRRLLPDNGERWVLLKGGHLDGDPLDLLYDGERLVEMPGHRIATVNTHGTGCTLAAAITALIPQRRDVATAVRAARTYLVDAIRHSGELAVGGGHGPVHHFHALWDEDDGAAETARFAPAPSRDS